MTKQNETKTPAQNVRAALKAAGFNARKVSVKSSRGSSSVYVSIKDHTLIKDEIQEIAESFESVRRCSYSGDILQGGNTFIMVSYSTEAKAEFKKLAAEIGELAEGQQARTPKGNLITRPINGHPCHPIGSWIEDHNVPAGSHYVSVGPVCSVAQMIESLTSCGQY